MAYCNFQTAKGAIFVKRKMCVKIPLNIVVLQRCPGLHVIFFRLMYQISLFGTNPRKNHTLIILMFFNENENDVKMIIPSNIAKSY